MVVSFRFRFKDYFTILVKVKVSYFEIEHNFILSASTQFNENTEEICKNLLD
jgi:hypothetical protein